MMDVALWVMLSFAISGMSYLVGYDKGVRAQRFEDYLRRREREIRWTAHLANRKASFYEEDGPHGESLPAGELRQAAMADEDAVAEQQVGDGAAQRQRHRFVEADHWASISGQMPFNSDLATFKRD